MPVALETRAWRSYLSQSVVKMRRFEPRKEGQSPRDVEKRMFYKRPGDGHSLEEKT